MAELWSAWQYEFTSCVDKVWRKQTVTVEGKMSWKVFKFTCVLDSQDIQSSLLPSKGKVLNWQVYSYSLAEETA